MQLNISYMPKSRKTGASNLFSVHDNISFKIVRKKWGSTTKSSATEYTTGSTRHRDIFSSFRRKQRVRVLLVRLHPTT